MGSRGWRRSGSTRRWITLAASHVATAWSLIGTRCDDDGSGPSTCSRREIDRGAGPAVEALDDTSEPSLIAGATVMGELTMRMVDDVDLPIVRIIRSSSIRWTDTQGPTQLPTDEPPGSLRTRM